MSSFSPKSLTIQYFPVYVFLTEKAKGAIVVFVVNILIRIRCGIVMSTIIINESRRKRIVQQISAQTLAQMLQRRLTTGPINNLNLLTREKNNKSKTLKINKRKLNY